MNEIKPEFIKKVIRRAIRREEKRDLVTFLAELSKISKQKIKHAMICGAVWRKSEGKGKLLRVRKATSQVLLGDWIEMHFDEDILGREVAPAELVYEDRSWGIWYKPSGMLAQGNEFGDHLSLLRQVEKIKGEAFLVHRLDREVAGLMLVAYHHKEAAAFSKLWQSGGVQKIYRALVQGNIAQTQGSLSGVIRDSLDGQEAITHYKVLKPDTYESLVEIEIKTGRYHQIRRHFLFLGHAIMGDPRYGSGNKNDDGLQLFAYSLKFKEPLRGRQIEVTLPSTFLPSSFI